LLVKLITGLKNHRKSGLLTRSLKIKGILMLLTIAKPQQFQPTSDYFDGEFDAAIGLPPKSQDGDYWQGYLAKVNETGNTPF
jgi:hypothetical protein